MEKNEIEKEKRIEKELSRIQLRQKLELKYKNKERALERQQKAERDSYERMIYNKNKKRFNRCSSMPK